MELCGITTEKNLFAMASCFALRYRFKEYFDVLLIVLLLSLHLKPRYTKRCSYLPTYVHSNSTLVCFRITKGNADRTAISGDITFSERQQGRERGGKHQKILLQFWETVLPTENNHMPCLEIIILSVICTEVPVLFPCDFLKYCSSLINLQHLINLTFLLDIYIIRSLQ